MVKNRKPGLIFLLSIVTLGIYPLVMLCKLGKEVNRICDGDGRHQMHYIFAALLGLVTLGIFPTCWVCKAMNRLKDNEYRYGVTVQYSGSSFVGWSYLGGFIGVGPIIAWCIFAKAVGTFANVYGYIKPFPYTKNQVERLVYSRLPFVFEDNYQLFAQHVVANYAITYPDNYPSRIVQQPTVPVYTPVVPPAVIPPAPVVEAGKITCTKGEVMGASIAINNGDKIIIGKDASVCNLIIGKSETKISRIHCKIRFKDGKYYVYDQSTNGTFLMNGTKLESGSYVSVPAGTSIYLANQNTVFKLG